MLNLGRYAFSFFFLIGLFAGPGIPRAVDAGTIEPILQKSFQAYDPQDEIPVIIRAVGKASLDLIRDREKRVRRSRIIKTLRTTADVSQRDIRTFLNRKGVVQVRQLWLVNGIAVSANAGVIRELASLPGVESIALDETIHAPVTTAGTATAPEWNLSAIHAPDLWSLGFTGQGVVVANMDSGVDGAHPDLQTRWRGGANSWFDPNGEHGAPYDADGHGTQTMGIMVGGDAGGTSVGVAPGARWIAVKIFNDAGSASFSAIHLGYQWLLDPDGDPDTDDAPDVVNNSWGLDNTGTCVTEFQADVQALRAANIAIVFAAGNSGPNASTSVSPANYPESFSVGAVDSANTLSASSSRGPSACYGDHYPNVVAPGVDVRTTDLYLGIPGAYVSLSGTSFAAPHVAGALALLIGAFPFRDVPVIDTALMNSAADLGATGPDNDFGHGMIDVLQAYEALRRLDRVGVFSEGSWYLDGSGNGAWNGTQADGFYSFGGGLTGAVPVAGDWTGTGSAKIGVYHNGVWYLDLNGNGSWDGTPIDGQIYFGGGELNAVPVTGDWTGDGKTKIGIYADSIWYLDLNNNGAWEGTPTDGLYYFGGGVTGAVPVTGDWNGTVASKIGIFVPSNGQWYLDTNGSGAWDGTPTDTLSYFGSGLVGTVPVTGDWNASGSTKVGLFVPSTGEWFLDADGSGAWNGTPTDALAYFGAGLTGVVPVSGKW